MFDERTHCIFFHLPSFLSVLWLHTTLACCRSYRFTRLLLFSHFGFYTYCTVHRCSMNPIFVVLPFVCDAAVLLP